MPLYRELFDRSFRGARGEEVNFLFSGKWSEHSHIGPLRGNMRITFHCCDRSWVSITSENESHARASAAAARRRFKVRLRTSGKISTLLYLIILARVKRDKILQNHAL